MPSRLERSLWFSLSFDSSIICVIISCMFGWPPGAAGWAAPGLDAVTGDEAVVCANEGGAIKVANRIVINGINIFMTTSCQRLATTGK